MTDITPYRQRALRNSFAAWFDFNFAPNPDGSRYQNLGDLDVMEIAMRCMDDEELRRLVAARDDTFQGMPAIGYIKAARSVGFEPLSRIPVSDGILFVLGRARDAHLLLVSTERGAVYDARLEFALLDPGSPTGEHVWHRMLAVDVTNALKTVCSALPYPGFACPPFWWSKRTAASSVGDTNTLWLLSSRERPMSSQPPSNRFLLDDKTACEAHLGRVEALPAEWRHRLDMDRLRTSAEAISLWRAEAAAFGRPVPEFGA